jgi:chromosome segregation ATPase
MTKASKVLTILVTVFCILYMGIAFVMWTVRTDWKERATKDFPKSRIAEQKTRIDELDKEIAATDKQHEESKKGIAADIAAITAPQIGREAQLEAEWATLSAEASAIAAQIDVEAKKVQVKQEEDRRLREDVHRLMNQYEDLVAQRNDTEADVKRQLDLLFQAKGVLDRVRLRAKLLDAEEGKSDYESGSDRTAPAASRIPNTVK